MKDNEDQVSLERTMFLKLSSVIHKQTEQMDLLIKSMRMVCEILEDYKSKVDNIKQK